MQASCPQCSQKIVIDDARVPDRAFSVKCPKCQTVVKLPGKGAAGAAAAPAAAPPPPASAAAASAGPSGSEEMRASMMAELRREMAAPDAAAGSAGRAMVALPDHAHAAAVSAPLTRLGYTVDTLDDWEEGARLLEQGVFSLVVTARVAAAGGKAESLYQRANRLNPDGRRRIFLVLAGDEFKSGDGTQAFATLADLVLHSKDLPNADALIRNTVAERLRVYQVFLDARKRFEAAAG